MDDEQADEARVCASCGASLRADARFCASCGNWIGAEDPPAEVAPPVVEVVEPVVEPIVERPEVSTEPAPELVDPIIGGLEPVTELRPMPPIERPGTPPVSLSREPLNRVRRVLLALTLLIAFALVAALLRATR